MQRSITHQKPIIPFIYIVFFILYSSLSSIYPFLPPMLGVLFVLFSQALEKNDLISVSLVSLCLIVLEANYGFMLFSTVFYFYIIYKFVIPKIKQNFNCPFCIRISYVVLAYLGYYLFLMLIAKVFLLPEPYINYYIIYYIVIEFFLVSLL
jgi:hypothetical protein